MPIRSSIYSDLDIELTKATDGDVTRDKDVDAIINSLNNIVATMQGSRRMLPEFAQDLWNLLFEPLDEETGREIGNRLLEAIRTWEDRVEVRRIDISPDFENNTYNIKTEFVIRAIREVQEVNFIFYAQ